MTTRSLSFRWLSLLAVRAVRSRRTNCATWVRRASGPRGATRARGGCGEVRTVSFGFLEREAVIRPVPEGGV